MLGAVRVGIEGIPVIIRFKTLILGHGQVNEICIEGIPVIIRFKTAILVIVHYTLLGIEGIPVIIRFKTFTTSFSCVLI